MDYGLLAGLAQGLQSGVQSYQQSKRDAADEALKKRAMKTQQMEAALKFAENYGEIPQGVFDKEVEDVFRGGTQEAKQSGLLADSKNDQAMTMAIENGATKSGLISVPGIISKKEKERIKQENELTLKNLDARERGVEFYRDERGLIRERPAPETQQARNKRLKDEMEMKSKTLEIERALRGLRKDEEERQKAMSLEGKLEKKGAEAQAKVGGLANSLATLKELDDLYSQGKKKSYITSDLPVVGQFMTDTDVDVVTRKLTDDIGRLRSGGAINKDEETRFMKMLPRAGDTPEIAQNKIRALTQEFQTRVRAYGVSPEEASKLTGQSKAMTAEDQMALDWAKQNPNDPRSKEILKSLGVR